GPNVGSAAGLFLRLRFEGWRPLKKFLEANKEKAHLFERMLATSMLIPQSTDEYFELRQASDFLTIHLLARAEGKRSSVKQRLANARNAAKTRGNARSISAAVVQRELEKWKKSHKGNTRGFLSFAAKKFGLDRMTVGARLRDAAR